MGSLPLSIDILPDDAEAIGLDEAAHRLGVSTSRVRTLIRDHNLLAASRGGQAVIPAAFFSADGGGFAKHLEGLITTLLDGGYTRDEALAWLFAEQDDLGLRPADALHTHSAREVIRRAQAQAF